MTTLLLPERALSIQQPWASLIAEGFKLIENRTWNTRWRGTLAIHAGKKIDPTSVWVGAEFGIKPPYIHGAYIAIAELVDVHLSADRCCGIWAEPGQYHWRLADPRPLDEPIPARGRLGLYVPPQGIEWRTR